MSLDTLVIGFCVGVPLLLLWVARTDVLAAGMGIFLYIYTVFAIVGYRWFPEVSMVLGLYFGSGVIGPYVIFVGASFIAFAVGLRLTHARLVRANRFTVRFEPHRASQLLVLAGSFVFFVLMTAFFIRDYDKIDYANVPQIPGFVFALLFKFMVVPILVLYASVRRHTRGGFLRAGYAVLGAALMLLFLSIASKAGDRTDVLALMLAITMYELYPSIADGRGRFAMKGAAARRLLLLLPVVSLLLYSGYRALDATKSRRSAAPSALVAPETAIFLNDYYPPAHMLIASMATSFIDPALVLKSNLANALFVGGALGVPYLQEPIGNAAVPGSSTRSASFAFFLFTEGYMVMGSWGVLYNAFIVIMGITLWRLLSSTNDMAFNALMAAITAAFFATFARTQSMLIVRNFYFFALPAVVLMRLATGARLSRSPAQ